MGGFLLLKNHLNYEASHYRGRFDPPDRNDLSFSGWFHGPILEDIAKLIFSVILNAVNDLKLLKIRDSSLRSE